MALPPTPFLAAAGAALLVAAQIFHGTVDRQRKAWPRVLDEPYAPSSASAPYVTLGYRELASDLFRIRMRAYFGGDTDTAPGLRALAEATLALDPTRRQDYEWAARAMGWVDGGASTDDLLWAAQLVERGIERFPDDFRLLKAAGEIYVLDLESDDPAEQAAWRDHGTQLLERAVRMPGAPKSLGTLIAHIRSELGQHERAVRELRELILTTPDPAARERLIAKLADLEQSNADVLADELHWQRERFEARWKAAMPEVPETMYILLGDPPAPYIDLGDLAADPVLFTDDEVFEPIVDP